MSKLLATACLAISLFVTTLALAHQDSEHSSLAYTFEDPRLEWGPCPPFMPEGCAITVLHGDPAEPNVDVFFKVPGGAQIPSHAHTSAERMVLVSGALEVTYEGESPVRLEVGSYAYGPAMKPHTAVCLEGDPCVLFIAFEAPLDAMPTEPATDSN